MSMMGYVAALSSAQIAAFRAQPQLASAFADTAADDLLQARVQSGLARMPPEARQQYADARRELLAQDPAGAEKQARREALRPLVEKAGPYQPVLELGDTWKLLNYLITGHADEAPAPGDALVSGAPIGDDLGYGPPLLNDPARTLAFRDFLAPITAERLSERVDFNQIARLRIYPIYTAPDAANAEAWRDDIRATFTRLKPYVAAAADRGDGLLVWVL